MIAGTYITPLTAGFAPCRFGPLPNCSPSVVAVQSTSRHLRSSRINALEQTVHLAGFLKDQDTGDRRHSRTRMSVPPRPVRSLEQLVNRRLGHKSELPPSYDSILSIPEKSLPEQMRARAELSLQVRWDNQDRKRLRPSFYTALFFQVLQYRTVPERSAHLTRCGPPGSSGCQPLTPHPYLLVQFCPAR